MPPVFLSRRFFRRRPADGTARLALSLAGLFAALAPAAWAAPLLEDIAGRVSTLKPGAAEWRPAVKGEPLEPGEQVRTEARSRAVIRFDDASSILLGSHGSFTLEQASQVRLTLGSLRAKISKMLLGSFKVRTPTAVCSVRGTEFQVDVNNQGNTAVQMFDGTLVVADAGEKNEVLIKDTDRIQVTDKGLGPVETGAGAQAGSDQLRAAMKREVGLEMGKEEVQAAAALEAKNAIYQQGKAIIDVNGNRVRIEEYIIRSSPNEFKLVVLNERSDRFDFFYYRGTFNQALPTDISIALRQLPGCIGGLCQFFMTAYETGRSNTVDNMLEVTSGGHQVDVNNNAIGATDDVSAAFDPASDRFVALAAGTPFFKTLFDNYRLTFNGVEHSKWAPNQGGTIQNQVSGTTAGGHLAVTNTTVVQNPPACAPPECTFTEEGVLHQVIYASNPDGSIWEKYDSYIISDEGKIARTSDFAGITSGTQYKQTLLNWNFQQIVTASEFKGRKIDLAVEPRIFIQSGLIP